MFFEQILIYFYRDIYVFKIQKIILHFSYIIEIYTDNNYPAYRNRKKNK